MTAASLLLLLAVQHAEPAAQSVPAAEATLRFSPAPPYRGLTLGAFTQRFYPAEAAEQEKSGWAEIACEVGPDLRPLDCAVVEETPPDFRFGAASLRMIPQFTVATVEGRPARPGDRFRYTVQFGVSAAVPPAGGR